MSDTSSTIKRSVGLVKTCSSYKNKTLVHNTILPRPIVIMLKCKSNQSFDTFSLIRCFSDILIRMSESYTQMMLLISDENVNISDSFIWNDLKIWSECQIFWHSDHMVRMWEKDLIRLIEKNYWYYSLH